MRYVDGSAVFSNSIRLCGSRNWGTVAERGGRIVEESQGAQPNKKEEKPIRSSDSSG